MLKECRTADKPKEKFLVDEWNVSNLDVKKISKVISKTKIQSMSEWLK